MEKISGIIAANARTRSVDVASSQPVRPGAPAYGRAEGKVTVPAIEDKISLSSIASERPLDPGTYKNSGESAKLKIIKDSTQRFFETRVPQTIAKESEAPLSEEILEKISDPSLSRVNPDSSKEAMA